MKGIVCIDESGKFTPEMWEKVKLSMGIDMSAMPSVSAFAKCAWDDEKGAITYTPISEREFYTLEHADDQP